MKTHTLSALCAAFAVVASGALATEAPLTMSTSTDDMLPDYNNINVSYGLMFEVNDGLSVDVLNGGSLGIGYTFKNTTKSSHFAGASIGYFYGTATNTLYGAETKNTQQIFPVMLQYRFVYKTTENFHAYIGGQAGAYVSRTQFKSSPSEHWFPEHDLKSQHTRVSPTVGIDLGFQYKVSKRFIWDTGVSLNLSASLTREPEEDGHRLGAQKTTISGVFHTGFTYQY